MDKNLSAQRKAALLTLLAAVVLAAAGLAYFSGKYKALTVLAGVVCIAWLVKGDLRLLRPWPVLLLLGYVVFSGLTRFWAISGKFFLEEFSEIFVAGTLFLGIMLMKDFDRRTMRRLMSLIAIASGLYALLSVEAASTGLSRKLLGTLLPGISGLSMGFEAGTRLTGILGNANVLSSVLALGILYSICLLCGEENIKTRYFYAGLLTVNAFTFLLLFSMGGTACFAVAVLVYLLFAGRQWVESLIRMLECAVPSLLWVFAAFPFFNRAGAAALVPLLALAGAVVTVVLLERFLAPKLLALLERRERLALLVLVGVILCVAAYLLLGVSLSGAYTFRGAGLRRSAYPQPGTHSLAVQATGDVQVSVVSQDMTQVMMHTDTVLYSGPTDGASFTVPEGSRVCYFNFWAEDGTVLEEARLDSGERLKLKYTLLPGFIANRLQGLRANQNAIQRVVFFQDGMKMFYQSPLVGNGVGSFGTGITSVQDFYYESIYIHNHYIQILLESGIIGFVLFAGALVGMFFFLLKKRKTEDWEFRGEYPAMWAAMVMTAAHMAVEVSMSFVIFLSYAFATFGMVLRSCSEPPAEPEPVPVKKKSVPKKKKGQGVRFACAVLPAVYTASVCCNMAAGWVASSASYSTGEFLQHMELTALLDPYEGNDAKLTYVTHAYDYQVATYMPLANQYAGELLKVHSNSIPSVLLEYYLLTGQYGQAIEALRAASSYSASSHTVWNRCIDSLRRVLVNGVYSPLLEAESYGVLSAGIAEYYRTLQARNGSSMEEIELNVSSRDFFGKMLALEDSGRSTGEILNVLTTQMFDSAHSCDANSDGIPDQISDYAGAGFGADGAIALEAGGWIDLELLNTTLGSGGFALLRAECQDPAALEISGAQSVEPQDGQGTYLLLLDLEESVTLRISSAAAQSLSRIYVELG